MSYLVYFFKDLLWKNDFHFPLTYSIFLLLIIFFENWVVGTGVRSHRVIYLLLMFFFDYGHLFSFLFDCHFSWCFCFENVIAESHFSICCLLGFLLTFSVHIFSLFQIYKGFIIFNLKIAGDLTVWLKLWIVRWYIRILLLF